MTWEFPSPDDPTPPIANSGRLDQNTRVRLAVIRLAMMLSANATVTLNAIADCGLRLPRR